MSKLDVRKMNTLDYILNKFKLGFDGKTAMPIEIPNVGRDNLPALFKELGFKIGAEVGVLDGEFSEKFCQANPKLKLFCIDPWEIIGDFDDYDSKTLERSYATAKARLADYNCTIIKKTSMDAVKDFADGSLDFVYIDADHEFKAVVMDISEWIRKVRIGGIICGHDFIRYVDLKRTRCHVVDAVTGFTSAYRIRPWFVLGRKEKRHDEIRDKERSWMWVKLQ